MECACSYELYMIKWQAILLRMHPFPPHIFERIHCLPRSSTALSKKLGSRRRKRRFLFYYRSFCMAYIGIRVRRNYGEAILGGQGIFLFSHKNCEFFPCHKGAEPENFNCLFCYCPLYALGEKCGGNFRITEKGIKDCTNCRLPINGKITDMWWANMRSLRN